MRAAVAFVAAGCTSSEQEFVDEVRDDGPAWTELVEMGHAACEVMETQTPMEFVLYGMEGRGRTRCAPRPPTGSRRCCDGHRGAAWRQ